MKRQSKLLFGILSIQVLVLTYVFGVKTHTPNASAIPEPLLGLSLESVDRVMIESPDATSLELKKSNAQWVLPNHFTFNAQTSKVDQLLQRLVGFNKTWALANSTGAARKFKLELDNYERKVTFYQDNKPLKTLLLGTSPRYKQVHARVASQADIYEMPVGIFEMSLQPEDWTDKQYFHLAPEQIKTLTTKVGKLARDKDKFMLTKMAIDSDKQPLANLLGNKLSRLSFKQIVDPISEANLDKGEPILGFEAVLNDDVAYQYRIFALTLDPENPTYLLQRSDTEALFELASQDIKSILELERKIATSTKVENEAEQAPVPENT